MSEFDQFALDVLDDNLECQGWPVTSVGVEEKYVKLLYVKDLHGLSNAGIVEYLDPPLRKKLGLQANLHPSTVWRKERALKDDTEQRNAISKAAIVAVYEACLRLDTVPGHVLESHDIPGEDALNATPRKRKQEAMRNWARWLLEDVLEPLTFHRAGEDADGEEVDGYDYRRFVGLCAHCALENIASNSGVDTADYLYDRDHIPSGSALLGNIRALVEDTEDEPEEEFVDKRESEKPPQWPEEIQQQFAECYKRFFRELDRLGLLDTKKQLAVDATKVATTSDKETTDAVTAGSGSGREPATYGRHSWTYQFVSITNAEAPFVTSVTPIYDGSQKQDRVDEQLEAVIDDLAVDVDMVLCDKGYYRKDVIAACRENLDEERQEWVICGKVGGDIADLMDRAPEGAIVSHPNVTVGQPSIIPKPGGFVYPNTAGTDDTKRVHRPLNNFGGEGSDDNEQWQPFLNEDDHKNTHIAYITDMELTDANMRKIHVQYQQRKAIESTIGQVRDIHAPYTESLHPAVRAYMVNMAALMYNLHHLINRTLSREHGIPLSPTGKEVLTAIRDVAFR